MNLESLNVLLARLETQRDYESEDEMVETYDFFIEKVEAEIEYVEGWSTAGGSK